jgi:hypothetical protein
MWKYEHLLGKKKLIWIFCVKMTLWHLRKANFPKKISLLSSWGKERWDNSYHFSFFLFFQFHQLCELTYELEHLLEQKKLIWTFCVEMAPWQVEGDRLFQKNQNCHSFVLPRSGTIVMLSLKGIKKKSKTMFIIFLKA